MRNNNETSRGFANLMGIMIITVIGLSACITLLGIDTAGVTNSLQQESFARAEANSEACTEKALLQLRGNDAYAGQNLLALNAGTCQSTVTNTLLDDGTRTIVVDVEGATGDSLFHRRASLTITYTPPDNTPAYSRVIISDVP